MKLIFPAITSPHVGIVDDDHRFPIHRIYCVGQNYAKHALEMGSTARAAPFFFMKPADALVYVPTHEKGRINYPSLTKNFHHEVELVVAIGKAGTNITVAKAPEHIFGFAVGLDMTRRDLQTELKKAGRPWSIAKGFEQSAVIGPLVPTKQCTGIHEAQISLSVNGQQRQCGFVHEMIWNIAEVIAEISKGWTLQPGDLVFTGTPAGVGAVERGDYIHAYIQGLPDLDVEIV